MRQNRTPMMAALCAVTLFSVAACGSSTKPSASPTTAPGGRYGDAATTVAAPATTTAPPAASGLTVSVATTALGSILVDSKGFTLYAFTKDTQGKASVCTGGCSGTWPALAAPSAPAAGSGVDASKLSVIARADGTPQAAYNGWPLYYFAKDAKAGDTAGNKVGGVWFVVDATGNPVQG